MSTLSLEEAREFTEDMYDLDPFDDIDEFEHDKVHEIYRTHPSLCRERLSDETCPLLHVLQYRPSLALVKCVFYAYPQAITEKDSLEYTPLHMACLHKCSREVVEFVAKKYPAACKKGSKYGGAPIDVARQHEDEEEEYQDIVRFLFKMKPHVRFDNDTKGSQEDSFQQLVYSNY